MGLLFSSPIFAEASKHSGAFKLMGVGLAVWAVSILGCALSVNFGTLLLCRMGVGVGEASFVALASPFIGTFGVNARPKSDINQQMEFPFAVNAKRLI